MSKYYETRFNFNQKRNSVWLAIVEYIQKFVEIDDVVLDVGSGYCDFINNIECKKKFALDINNESSLFCNQDVFFINSTVNDLSLISNNSIDIIFASNLLEHLNDIILDQTISEFYRVLRLNGKVILMQPNFKYAFSDYFDDYTHVKIFTHISLVDFMNSKGFVNIKLIPKFLPLTLKSKLPKSYWLTKLYLLSPFKPFAKQMFGVFIKK